MSAKKTTEMAKPEKFIVWDWNGTLFDDAESILAVTNLIMRRLGRDGMGIEEFRNFYSIPFYPDFWTKAGFADDELATAKEKSADFQALSEQFANGCRLREHAHDILKPALAGGVHSVILSNHMVDKIRARLSGMGVTQYFNAILANPDESAQFKEKKINFLYRYLEQHQHGPEQVVLIGDTPEEPQMARELQDKLPNAKIISIAITGGCASQALLEAARPDHLVHDMKALRDVLAAEGFVP